MKPNPTELAILISLLGVGLPWPETALGKNGVASASASSGMSSKHAAVRSALNLLEAPKPQIKVSQTAKKSAPTKRTMRAPSPPERNTTPDTIAWDKAALGLEAGVDPLSGRAVVGRQIETRRPVRDDQLAMIKVALGLGSYRPTAKSIAILERRPLDGRARQVVVAVAEAVPAIPDEPLRPEVDADGPLLESPEFMPGSRIPSLFDSNGPPGKPLRDKDESPPMLADELRGAARREQRWSPALGLVTTVPSDASAAVEMQSAATTLNRSEEPGANAGTLPSQFEVFADDRRAYANPIFGGTKTAERDADRAVPDFSLLSTSAEPASPILIDVRSLAPENRPSQSILPLGTDKYGPNDSALHSTLDLFEQSALVARASPESPPAPTLAPDLPSLQTGSAVVDSESISSENNHYATRPFLAPDALLRAFARELGANDIPRAVDALHKQEGATGQPSIEHHDVEARDDFFAVEQERDIERILSGRNVDRTADSTEFAAGAAERFPSADAPMGVRLMERMYLPADEAKPSKSPGTLAAVDINLDELDGFQNPLSSQLPPVASVELPREMSTVNHLALTTLYINLDELDGFRSQLLPRMPPVASAKLPGGMPTIDQLALADLDINLDELREFHYPLLPRFAPIASTELLGEMATIDQFNALSTSRIGLMHRHDEVQFGADELDEMPTASAWASAMWRAAEPETAKTRRPSEVPMHAESTMQLARQNLAFPVNSIEEPATKAALMIQADPRTESSVVKAMAKLATNTAAKVEPVLASESSMGMPATEPDLKIEAYPRMESNVVRAMARLAANPVVKAEPVRSSDGQTPRDMSPLNNPGDTPAPLAITQAASALVSGVAPDRTTHSEVKHSDSIAESHENHPKLLGGELLALGDSKLDQMRGGFETDSGLKISFGIERAVYINGSLVTTTSLNVADLGKLTAGQAQAAGLNGASLALVQNGSGNTFQPGQISSSNIGTVIQNTLNDQKIQGVTLINATVNSLEFIKGINLQSTIKNAITDSLRR